MSNLDPLVVVGAVTGIAALFVSLYSVSRVRKYVQLVERQTLFQRTEVYPILRIEERSFQKDVAYLRLNNVGKGPAVDIGLKTYALPLKPGGGVWDLVGSLSGFQERKKVNLYPSHITLFLKNEKHQITLLPDSADLFSAGVLFGFNFSKKETEVSGKAHSFDELKKMLLANKLRFAALFLSLVYKDLTETILETEPICSLVMDVQKHGNIEEVIQDHIPFTQRTVGYEELDWIPWYIYSKFKSDRGSLEKSLS
jgi:hypothetical protein